MAGINILEVADTGPPTYLLAQVTFAGQSFDQMLVTVESGAALQAQLQTYADEYEQDWVDQSVGGDW